MKTILIFDQAESAGGSINRAVDLAEKLNEFKFIFLTLHTLKNLHSHTDCKHISNRVIYSFYNGKIAARHNQWIERSIKSYFLKKFMKKLVELCDRVNRVSTLAQALIAISFQKIDIVQANCGFHHIPWHIAKNKKSKLIYYFRDLQDYTKIDSKKIDRAEHYVFVSNALMAEYQKQLKLPESKCSMNHSPFDVQERLQKEKCTDLSTITHLQNQGKKVIILVSRIAKDKGQHVALAAVHQLKEKFPDFVLLLVGKADPDALSQSYLQSINDYVNQHNLCENVLFLGHRSDALHLIKQADISLQTPIYFEAMAGVLIESLQLGVLTVSADIGGAREAIKDRHSGFLFQPGDYLQLSSILLEILDGRVNTAPIIEAGKKHATLDWAPASIQQKMKAIYLDTEHQQNDNRI